MTESESVAAAGAERINGNVVLTLNPAIVRRLTMLLSYCTIADVTFADRQVAKRLLNVLADGGTV